MEEFFEARLVQDFDADVPVQRSCYQARDEIQDIPSDQRATHRHALVGRIDHVLALEAVDVDAEEDVDAEDEGFGDEQRFPEVEGSPHLGHEFAVDHCTAVGEDGLHEAEDLAAEVDVWRGTGAGCDGGDWRGDVDAILAGRGVRVYCFCGGRGLRWRFFWDLLGGCFVVWLAVSDYDHC